MLLAALAAIRNGWGKKRNTRASQRNRLKTERKEERKNTRMLSEKEERSGRPASDAACTRAEHLMCDGRSIHFLPR